MTKAKKTCGNCKFYPKLRYDCLYNCPFLSKDTRACKNWVSKESERGE